MSGAERRPGSDLEAWRQALADLARETGARPDCPSAEQIWRAAAGELDRSAMDEFLDHVTRCAHCGEALRLAGRLGEHAELGAETRSTLRSPLLAVAAGVLLLVVTGWVAFRVAAPEAGSEGGMRAAQRSTIVSEVAPDATLPRSRFVLRWSAPVPDLSYSIRVADEELNVLAERSGFDEPVFRVPEEALAGLGSGAVVLWQVTGTDPDGAELESPTFVNHVE